MQIVQLPPSVFDWSEKLSGWGTVQWHNGALQRSDASLPSVYPLLMMGRKLSVSDIDAMLRVVASHGHQPWFSQPWREAGVDCLALGLSAYDPTLFQALKKISFPFDWAYQPQWPTLECPGLLVMDMDSTAIRIECIDEIADIAGVGDEVALITARAMRGELDFQQSLRERLALLKNVPLAQLQTLLDNLPWMNGLAELVLRVKDCDWSVYLISSGFTLFAEQLMQRLPFDGAIANRLDVQDGRLCGTVQPPIIDATQKRASLIALKEQYQLPWVQTVAIGDGANDRLMLQTAGLGIGLHAKPTLRAIADCTLDSLELDGVCALLTAAKFCHWQW